MNLGGAKAAIIQATGMFYTSPGMDYSYRQHDDMRVRQFHRQSADSKLNFSLPHRERRGKRAANNLNRTIDMILAGQVIRVIDDQPEPIRSWLYFAYGASRSDKHIMSCHSKLTGVYTGENERAKKLYRQVAAISMVDSWHRMNNGTNMYKKSLICHLCGIYESNYRKTIEPKLVIMNATIDNWNMRGLLAVSRVINILTEDA